MAYPLPLDLAPSSFEVLLARLPAHARAQIDWFPAEARSTLIAPLLAATAEELPSVVADLCVPAYRLFARLGEATSALVAEPALAKLIATEPGPSAALEERAHRRLSTRALAEAIVETEAWLRAIAAAMTHDFRTQVVVSGMSPEDASLADATDDEIHAAVEGELGFLLRGILFSVSAIEVVVGDGPLVQTIGVLIRFASSEVQAAANALRALGLPIPTAVRPRRPRRIGELDGRRLSLVRSGALPPGVLDYLVEALEPDALYLFGSRARGLNAPDSDWDLLAVLPDDADAAALEHRLLRARPLLRARVEVFTILRSELEEARASIGTLAQIATTQGYAIYER